MTRDLEVPASWPPSLDVKRFKNQRITLTPDDLLGHASGSISYAENSKVRESLLLMKFYSLSSGVMNVLLSDHEGRELDLPFEVTDQEMETILYNRSTFILGRSGTGKTTVLTMKLYQKEQQHHIAEEGFYGVENDAYKHASSNNGDEQISASSASDTTLLRQLFVTLSPRLCFAVKQHVSQLKRWADYSKKDVRFFFFVCPRLL